jgi:hypothetical protein
MARKPFSVSFTYEIEEGVDVDLLVEGTADECRGRRRGHPDTWEEPSVEIEVGNVYNKRGCPLPAAVIDALRADDRFMRAVEGRL